MLMIQLFGNATKNFEDFQIKNLTLKIFKKLKMRSFPQTKDEKTKKYKY